MGRPPIVKGRIAPAVGCYGNGRVPSARPKAIYYNSQPCLTVTDVYQRRCAIRFVFLVMTHTWASMTPHPAAKI
jgi:hypothetical protein